ncbi:MAG: flippase-like domain-containing protein [Gemmatimonadetes bacterium]|nr:flippase-like domain-containing protein [Gemmatimonadota bacterium]
MSRRLRWAAAWLVATALLVACFRSVGWDGVVPVLARMHPAWLAAAVAANAAILFLWAWQWTRFLPHDRSVPYPRMLRVTTVMAMIANSVPFLAGQAAGLHLLATRGRVGHAAAVSVTALDQLAEGVAKVAVLLLLAAVAPLPGRLKTALVALSTGVALLAAAVAVLSRSGTTPRALARGRLAPVGRFVGEVRRALASVRRPRILVGGVVLALAMKAAELAGILAVAAAFGAGVGPAEALLVLVAVNLATMVSVAPANLGVYEGSAFLAWRAVGAAPELALGLAVVQHLAYLLPMAGGGWLTVTLWRGRRVGLAADDSGEGTRTAAPDGHPVPKRTAGEAAD